MRLTKTVRQQILNQNDGFTTKTYFDSQNLKQTRVYTIANGALYIKSTGKTSWSDSDFDKTAVASDEEVHRFLYKNLNQLNTHGIE